jgi:hypothetical protein
MKTKPTNQNKQTLHFPLERLYLDMGSAEWKYFPTSQTLNCQQPEQSCLQISQISSEVFMIRHPK